jgi:undecaprenyl-diphosphatase
VGENWIDDHLGEPWMIAILLAVFGIVLWAADRRPERLGIQHVTVRRGFMVGLAQMLALAPGTSRSGITISAGRFLGFDRDAAARFSFLLLVPATAGAVLVKAHDVVSEGLPDGVVGPMIVGTIAAAVSGYAAIAALLAFVRRRSYDVFVWYRLAAAGVIAVVILSGLRDATF